MNTTNILFPTTDFLRQLFGDDEKLYIQWFLATRGFRGPINW